MRAAAIAGARLERNELTADGAYVEVRVFLPADGTVRSPPPLPAISHLALSVAAGDPDVPPASLIGAMEDTGILPSGAFPAAAADYAKTAAEAAVREERARVLGLIDTMMKGEKGRAAAVLNLLRTCVAQPNTVAAISDLGKRLVEAFRPLMDVYEAIWSNLESSIHAGEWTPRTRWRGEPGSSPYG